MFCPECRSEYLAGTDTCADCGVKLTASPPPAPEPGKIEHDNWPLELDPKDCEEILVHNNPGLIGVLKSVLESDEVPHFVHGEHYGQYFSMASIRLIVPKKEAARVREMIEEAGEEEARNEEDGEE